MATTSLTKIREKAERLSFLRKEISVREEMLKLELDGMRTERDKISGELIEDMKLNKLASIKTEDGDNYVKAVKHGVSIVNELLAYKWALENRAVKIDSILAAQIIKEMEEPPAGFEKIETEYISVRKSKSEKKDESK